MAKVAAAIGVAALVASVEGEPSARIAAYGSRIPRLHWLVQTIAWPQPVLPLLAIELDLQEGILAAVLAGIPGKGADRAPFR